MKINTGHELTRYFQFSKHIIRQFADDFGCKMSETASTLILEKDGKRIEIMPKKKEYKDLQTNTSDIYFNERACLMKFFNCYNVH